MARLLGGPWSTRNRLDAARLVLAEAMKLDQSPKETRRAQATWRWASAEWGWIARDRRAASALVAELGCTGEEVVKLQASIRVELLPMLHLQALVLSASKGVLAAPHHLTFARSYTVPVNAPSGLVVATVLAAAALGEMEHGIPAAWMEPVVRAVSERLLPPRAESALLTHICRALARVIGAASTAPSPALMSVVNRVADAPRPSLSVIELLSFLHAVTGMRSPPEVANRHLGLALLVDPTNSAARQCRAELHEYVRSKLPPGIAGKVQAKLAAADQELEVMASSPWGLRVQTRFQSALEIELMERLGLAPFDPDHRRATSKLLSHVDEARRRGTDIDLRTLARGAPEIPQSALRQVKEAMASLNEAPVSTLALLLPMAELPSCASLAPGLGTHEGLVPRKSRPFSGVWAWCGSSRDRVFKLAAAAGVLMVLHGGGRIALSNLARWREDRAYAAALSAARAGDDQTLVREGSKLLDIACQEANPRCSQVRTLVPDAVLREVARAMKEGRPEEGRRLLLTQAIRPGVVKEAP